MSMYPVKVQFREVHALETVAFQSSIQITNYQKIHVKWGIDRHSDPWSELKLWYPANLVNEMQNFYASGAAQRRYAISAT
jgi:hypothetical protein